MKIELKEEELTDIKGGAWKLGLVGAIIAGSAFVIGVFDGFFRPYPCRK